MYGNHFKFKELIYTDTGLDNTPSCAAHLSNLAAIWDTLNYLRETLGRPIIVNSAYRTDAVNKQVGGSKRSLHKQGRAADIRCEPMYMDELWSIIEFEKDNFSEIIKYSTFYHIAI